MILREAYSGFFPQEELTFLFLFRGGQNKTIAVLKINSYRIRIANLPGKSMNLLSDYIVFAYKTHTNI